MNRGVFIFAAAILIAASSFGATIHVPSQQPTIQAGINAASNGDTVLVSPGTYNGRFDFNGKAIVLKSSDGPPATTLQGATNDGIVVFAHGETRASIIEGFTFRGGTIALNCQNGSPTIRHNVFTDQTYCCFAAVISYSPFVFENNTVCFGANGGIAVYDTGAIVMNNIFAYNPGYGIYLYSPSSHVTHNDVYSVSVPSMYWSGKGEGNISIDPMFSAAAARDFRLTSASPCRDSGNPADEYRDPDGSRNDMGALPYGGGQSALPLPLGLDITGKDDQHVIATLSPVFTWRFYDTTGGMQSQYQIQAGVDRNWVQAPIWDSGPVNAGDSIIAYSGPPLTDHNKYFARARVHNGTEWGGWYQAYFVTYVSHIVRVPGDQSLIQEALNIARTGDTVLVAAGTYHENILFPSLRVKLLSEKGRDSTTIIAADPNVAVVTFANETDTGRSIDGFSITGTTDATGIVCKSGRPSILNCDIGNCTSIDSAGGIVCGVPSYPIILNNRIHDNVVTAGGGAGGGLSVWSHVSTPAQIEGNEIFNNQSPTGAGISINGGYAVVQRNIIHHNTGPDSSFSAGIYLYLGDPPARVINNTILHNTAGVALNWYANSDVRNNIIAMNQFGGLSVTSSYYTFAYNDEWGNGTDYGLTVLGGLAVDPLIFDPENGNYALFEMSPCRNAGDPNPLYNDPDGSPNDIGAMPAQDFDGSPIVSLFEIPNEVYHHVTTVTPTFKFGFLSPLGTIVSGVELQVTSDTTWNTINTWSPPLFPTDIDSVVYAGSQLQRGKWYAARLRVNSSAGWSPWRAITFKVNRPPSPPVLMSPDNVILTSIPYLFTHPSADGDGDKLSYRFQVYADSNFHLIEWENLVEGQEGNISDLPNINAVENSGHWWFVTAWDGYQFGVRSGPMTFGIDHTPSAPGTARPLYPIEGADHLAIYDLKPNFQWDSPLDPDPIEQFSYRVELSSDSLFTSPKVGLVSNLTHFQFSDSLHEGTKYWWRVFATDRYGLPSTYTVSRSFWSWRLGDLDNSHGTDISDLSRLIDYLYISFSPITPPLVADVDGDCRVDIADLSRLIDYLYISFGALRAGCAP